MTVSAGHAEGPTTDVAHCAAESCAHAPYSARRQPSNSPVVLGRSSETRRDHRPAGSSPQYLTELSFQLRKFCTASPYRSTSTILCTSTDSTPDGDVTTIFKSPRERCKTDT